MKKTNPGFDWFRFLVTVAALVVVVAGMRASTAILVPFLLSVFISVICAPPLFWLQRKGVPTALAIVLVIVILAGLGMGLGTLIGGSIQDFSKSLPAYQERLTEQTEALVSRLEALGIDVPGVNLQSQELTKYLNPGAVMQFLGSMLTGMQKVLTNAFLILLTVVFILLEASILPAKVRAALSRPDESLAQFDQVLDGVKRYLAAKTFTSFLTGALITIWLAVLGVDYALLWGLLGFLLNYVPNVGSILAAIPGVLMALIQFGVGRGVYVALGYLVINVAIGNVLEPRLLGRRLGLSALVVFLSLVFWGWVLGPVGMVLSVPLTMILKVALESSEETHWIAILLGSDSSLKAVPLPAGTVPAEEVEDSKSKAVPEDSQEPSADASGDSSEAATDLRGKQDRDKPPSDKQE